MTKVLIIGGTGMLGHKLVLRWAGRFETYATIRGRIGDRPEYSFLDPARTFEAVEAEPAGRIAGIVRDLAPDVVVNAVGIIKQLPSSKNTIATLTVNSIFPHRLAEIAAQAGARLISVSTDCVFSGGRGMYAESDVPDAADLYGISKRLGEVTGEGCLTVRTSIIGPELVSAHSLLDWFLSNAGRSVRGFRRAIYSGFPTVVLADILGDVIERHPDLSGLYHVSSEPIDKYSLLCLVRDAYGAEIGIEPDDEFAIDRSLDSTRFREETGYRPTAWPLMVEAMAADDPRRGQIGRNRK